MMIHPYGTRSGYPAYPSHSSRGDARSCYVPKRDTGDAVLKVKVASRVRGLSDEAFREAVGTEEPYRSATAGPFRLPLLRSSGVLLAGGAGALSMQPLQDANIDHGGRDFTCDGAAADTVVRGQTPDRGSEERHLVGGARPLSQDQAADDLDREKQDHGGDVAARGGDASGGVGRDGRRRSRRSTLRRQAGPRRGGQDALHGGSLEQSRESPAQSETGAGQGLLQARERARRQALAGAPGTSIARYRLGNWSALDELGYSHGAIRARFGRQAARMAPVKWVNTTLGNNGSAIGGICRKLGTDHAALELTSFALRYNRRYHLQIVIPRFTQSAIRTEPMSQSPPHRRMTIGEKQVRHRWRHKPDWRASCDTRYEIACA